MPKARGTVVSLSEDYFWENKNTAFENLWTENLEPTASFFTVSMILHIANPVFKIVFAYRVLLCSVITIHSNGRTIVTNDNKTWKKNLSLTPPPPPRFYSPSYSLYPPLSLTVTAPSSSPSLILPILFSSPLPPHFSPSSSRSLIPPAFSSHAASPTFFLFSSHLHLPLPFSFLSLPISISLFLYPPICRTVSHTHL